LSLEAKPNLIALDLIEIPDSSALYPTAMLNLSLLSLVRSSSQPKPNSLGPDSMLDPRAFGLVAMTN